MICVETVRAGVQPTPTKFVISSPTAANAKGLEVVWVLGRLFSGLISVVIISGIVSGHIIKRGVWHGRECL